jgi:hypothetical protein
MSDDQPQRPKRSFTWVYAWILILGPAVGLVFGTCLLLMLLAHFDPDR